MQMLQIFEVVWPIAVTLYLFNFNANLERHLKYCDSGFRDMQESISELRIQIAKMDAAESFHSTWDEEGIEGGEAL